MRRRWGSQVAALLAGIVNLECAVAPQEGEPRLHPCEQALNEGDWQGLAAVCVGPEWELHARLGGVLAEPHLDPMKAFETATALFSTEVATDARFAAGYIAGADVTGVFTLQQARDHLRVALDRYLDEGRPAGASRAASFLARVEQLDGRLEAALQMAKLAVDESQKSGSPRTEAQALHALANVYDFLGKGDEAKEAFDEALERYTSPDEIAFVHHDDALFVLDSGDPDVALELLAIATGFRDRAKAEGLGVRDLDLSIPLNQAEALSQMGRFTEAKQELATIAPGDAAEAMVLYVRGMVAAREGDLDTGRRLFDLAQTDHLELDFAWPAATELARLYREHGHIDEAIGLYRQAIEIIEELRAGSDDVELRPWILARRRQPYVELLDLLAAHGYGAEALAVAESLHARALLDVVLSRKAGNTVGSADTVRAAELQLGARSATSLSKDELMSLAGAHEALVFVNVDDGFWRFHLVDGEVTSEHFDRDAVEAVIRYRSNLDDLDTATLAGEILLPDDLIASDQPLVLVGDIAWQTPFAALRWKGKLLHELRPVTYLPGLAALACSDRSWDDQTVAIGDPRGTLPEAAREVRELATRFSTSARIGVDATWDALAQSKDVRRLHLAVHGHDTRAGMTLELHDVEVTASQILDAGIAPVEVVLSGCNTATALDIPESWSGFPSAFLTAGSRSVIATLRSVDDKDAATFVAEYYTQRDSLAPWRAVQEVQRAVADTMPTKEWASFTAWGSPACELP